MLMQQGAMPLDLFALLLHRLQSVTSTELTDIETPAVLCCAVLCRSWRGAQIPRLRMCWKRPIQGASASWLP